jgi:hypothetical protein
MASVALFLSVMTPADVNGDFVLRLETKDFSTTAVYTESINETELVTLNLAVCGITTDMSEIEIAETTYKQLSDQIIAANRAFNGSLAYSEEQYPSTFQLTYSEHVVCIWSQAQFTSKIVNDSTNAILELAGRPCLITVTEAKANAVISDFTFGNLTDTEISKSIKNASAFLTNRLRNNIVITTYAKEYRTKDTASVRLSPMPVLDFSNPRLRQRVSPQQSVVTVWDKRYFTLLHDKGELIFRAGETLINVSEPYEIQNSIYITFISGYQDIPDEIKTAVIDLCKYKITSRDDIKSMKGGSGAFEFFGTSKVLKSILIPIAPYKMRP